MTTYGYSISWTHRGGTCVVSADGCDTPSDAYVMALNLAILTGWTPPRWWQFWRWSDTRPRPPEEQE